VTVRGPARVARARPGLSRSSKLRALLADSAGESAAWMRGRFNCGTCLWWPCWRQRRAAGASRRASPPPSQRGSSPSHPPSPHPWPRAGPERRRHGAARTQSAARRAGAPGKHKPTAGRTLMQSETCVSYSVWPCAAVRTDRLVRL